MIPDVRGRGQVAQPRPAGRGEEQGPGQAAGARLRGRAGGGHREAEEQRRVCQEVSSDDFLQDELC